MSVDDLREGSLLFVSYLAGRPPGPQALLESSRSREEGIARRHFTGTLTSIRKNRAGETVLTLWVEERDSPDGHGGLHAGAFRSFNPSLGHLLTLAVLEERFVPWGA